jgi:hypothetical protein
MKHLLTGICLVLIFSSAFSQKPYAGKTISVLELRNYVLRENMRDKFVDSFTVYIEDSQNVSGNYVLGKYHVEGADNKFFWIRGFENMDSRKEAMTSFYSSAYWSTKNWIPRTYLLNYHNVHLLKPVNIRTGDTTITFKPEWFDQPKGITVIDFYTGNHERVKMLEFFKTSYATEMEKAGCKQSSYWIATNEANSYPDLPVFQDKEMLVSIAFYKNKKEYEQVLSRIPAAVKDELERNVAVHTRMYLFPVK